MSLDSKNPFTIDPSIYATTNQRVTNFVVDYVIRLIIQLVAITIFIFFATLFGQGHLVGYVQKLPFIHELIISCVIALGYYNVMEMLFSISIGKLITGTVVVNIYGEKPSLRDLATRNICRLIPFEGLTFFGTPGNGWHDTLSGTYVVQRNLLNEKKNRYKKIDSIDHK